MECGSLALFYGGLYFLKRSSISSRKISAKPIVADGFSHTRSDEGKRVIFPGGCILSDSKIYVAYGKDDCQIWIATLDKKALMDSLVPCDPKK